MFGISKSICCGDGLPVCDSQCCMSWSSCVPVQNKGCWGLFVFSQMWVDSSVCSLHAPFEFRVTAAQSLSNPCCSSVLNQVTRVRVQLSATVATRTRCNHKFQKPHVPPLYCNPVLFFVLFWDPRSFTFTGVWSLFSIQLMQSLNKLSPALHLKQPPGLGLRSLSPRNFLQDQCNSTIGPSWLPTIKDTRCCDDSHHIENIPVTLRKQHAAKPIFKMSYFNIVGQFRHRFFFFYVCPTHCCCWPTLVFRP